MHLQGTTARPLLRKSAPPVSDITGLPEARIFTASTGVIGEPLPHDRIISQIESLNAGLSESSLEAAAKAIMTTDTFAKGASAKITLEGEVVSIAGIAKGSGMIAPDMATMLVYIFTDAKNTSGGAAGRAEPPVRSQL